MSELTDLEDTRRILRHLWRVAEETYLSMGRALGSPPASSTPQRPPAEVLADALDFLARAREGFVITLRTPMVPTTRELEELVNRVLVDWAWLEAMGLSREGRTGIQRPTEQLLAYHHSLIALAFLPHLPPEAVTYPGVKRSYADIPVPRTPGQTLDRLEEMERTISQVEALNNGEVVQVGEEMRHTYGFFEATHWLINRYLRPLLG